MKRIGNLYDTICSMDNLLLADEKARKGKSKQYGVQQHDKNRMNNLQKLQHTLQTCSYVNSAYTVFKIFEPKEREIFRLPFFPDRIVHHAVMNVMEEIFVSLFTADTYSCIKGRGIHGVYRNMVQVLKDVEGTRYCLKLDIKKFYPSVDHDVLKSLLKRKIKDSRLLSLLGVIIDSAAGLPIGNYLSQYLANFYLAYFDHWIKEVMRVKYYFRYADDIVILSDSKEELHRLLAAIRTYLQDNLKLEVKSNYQVFPVAARGIDYVGYKFYHTHVLLRKSIKKNFARKVAKKKGRSSLFSYYGWAKHCNSRHLLKKLLNDQLPRPEYKHINRLRRRKNPHRQRTEQIYSHTGLRNQRVEV